jgi:hypothetical protein
LGWRGLSKAIWGSRVKPAVSAEWPVALRSALADLERLIGSRPELESPGRSLARVLEAAFGEPAVRLMPRLEEESGKAEQRMQRIHEAWKSGQPALHCVTPILEGFALDERALAIALALGSENSRPAQFLCAFLKREPERVVDWIKRALSDADDSLELEQALLGLGLEPALVQSVLRLVLLPGLAGWSQHVCVQLGDGIWPGGQCPICGSAPALAESRGLEQRRRLRCDRCAADWPAEHLRCPFCSESDHRALRYAFVQGEQDRYRLSICDRCGGRIKVIATLGPLSPPGLLVAELAAIHLDLIDPAGPASV